MYCSIFGPIMETHEGDLTDIVRAGTVTSSSSSPSSTSSSDQWQFSWSDPLTNFSPLVEEPILPNTFGDPLFPNMPDPFPLHNHHHRNHIPTTPDSYFDTASDSLQVSISTSSGTMEEVAGLGLGGAAATATASCGNVFSNLIQVSPNAKLPISPPGVSPAATAIPALPDASMDCGLQISSCRNPGFRRRKNQVKKVVCIPAPAAANSRTSGGEVVPSDLWAWRKYGQKPIKGSPYPRGYYRCSSSKGCSARKQVERSRTDPNMLVITYTSEHNHPWPTQKNSLAGSTRYHTSKTSVNNNAEATDHHLQEGTNTLMKPKAISSDLEQQNSHSNNNNNTVFPSVVGDGSSVKSTACVKQEMEQDIIEEKNKKKKKVVGEGMMEDDGDELFAELGEIEADDYPQNLLLAQAFNNGGSKALDPFYDHFDWSFSPDNYITPPYFNKPRESYSYN